jgi:glutamate carboxypeptidase
MDYILPPQVKEIHTRLYGRQKEMADLLESWANINSGTSNLAGLTEMLAALKKAFHRLNGVMEEITLKPHHIVNALGNLIETPLGKALHIKKHPKAPIQIFLAGHMDTVYSSEHAFQQVDYINDGIMRGPGVADMKGGLVILLYALEILENSEEAGKIGWEVLINPDEEIGSPGSISLFRERAPHHDLALLFEPSFQDGSIVSSRKGSLAYSVVVRGKAAHAGRDFHSGRNAITALSKFLISAESLTDIEKGISVNIGLITGGHASNIVPDLAIASIDVRVKTIEDQTYIQESFKKLAEASNQQEGISLVLHELRSRAPKPFDEKNENLFKALDQCASTFGYQLQSRPSGGVCDGNTLSESGLATIDTLGAIGGNIHTPEEYIDINSLTERTKLISYFFIQLANKEIDLNPFKQSFSKERH